MPAPLPVIIVVVRGAALAQIDMLAAVGIVVCSCGLVSTRVKMHNPQDTLSIICIVDKILGDCLAEGGGEEAGDAILLARREEVEQSCG